MTDLRGVNAIVTGSTRGLGFAIARALLAAGANVIINGRTAAACEQAVERLRGFGPVGSAVGGVDDEATADALIHRCEQLFGPVNFVVNNAGITRDRSLLNMSVEEFDEVIAVHLRGTWLTCRAAARAMKDAGGGLVNITSGSALFGLVGQSNYAAAKGGINALTRSLSLELARFGISVNALYPIALTDMTAPVLAMAGGDDSPLRTVFGAADDVARVVVGLAAPTSTMTGQIISFDGTEMALWSHPDRVWKARSMAPWSDDDVAAALLHIAAQPAALNPDDVGAKTRAALRPKRG